jgi:predicted Fe-Mo cluster-binding NifX family protein
MRVAVTAQGSDLDAMVDVRFGRAGDFVIVDTDTGGVEHLGNAEGRGAGQGAGIQAARRMAEQGVQVVLTGHCGPNAFRTLQAAGIQLCTGLRGGTVREAIELFQAGKLEEANAADVAGHW